MVKRFATIVTSISPSTPQHEFGFFELLEVNPHLPQFEQELERVEQFGDDEAAIEWGLNPPAAEDQEFKRQLNSAEGRGM